MKKILLATTILSVSAGFAAADVSVSGDARMGVVATDGASVFSSRMRVKFTGSGTTHGGLTFGGSFRAADANGAGAGTKGSVYISGAFGKISMGDVDSGDAAAVGQLASVGYTGLGSGNSINYASDGFDLFGVPAQIKDSYTYYYDSYFDYTDPSYGDVVYTRQYDSTTTVTGGAPAKVLYAYSAGGLTLDASASQISNGPLDHSAYGLGVSYTTGGLTLAAGYGSNEFGWVTNETYTFTDYYDGQSITGPDWKAVVSDGSVTDSTIAATYVMGDTTIKAIYQDKQMNATYQESYYDTEYAGYDNEDAYAVSLEAKSMGLSVVHKIGALTLTGYDINTDVSSNVFEGDNSLSLTRTGIGASYDLGGGASVTGGVANVEVAVIENGWDLASKSQSFYDLGVNFSF